MPPESRQAPTMPLHTIMTAANTVSRARPALSAANPSMIETISATSMTVTATARTRVPKGSPIRWATTSAWQTAPNTVAISAPPARRAITAAVPATAMMPMIAQAESGHTHAHQGVRAAVAIDCAIAICDQSKATRPPGARRIAVTSGSKRERTPPAPRLTTSVQGWPSARHGPRRCGLLGGHCRGYNAGGVRQGLRQGTDDGGCQLLGEAAIALVVHVQVVGREVKAITAL